MASVSGLSRHNREVARARVKEAAFVGLHHAPQMHYTQNSVGRWEGIHLHLVARNGHFPNHADCSGFATWCVWNGLFVPFGVRDTVSNSSWNYGYTGSMVNHGKRVRSFHSILPGDLAFYGNPVGSTGHVAVCVGGGLVISFGSEPGPFLLPIKYRSDFGQIRRYI